METEASLLFFLMTTLSRLKEGPRTVGLFLESIESIFPGICARWSEDCVAGATEDSLQICTREHNFGWLTYQRAAVTSSVDAALLLNAAQMLGSILEKQKQEQLLLNQNLHLEALVEERTRHLKQTTEELGHYFEHSLDLFCIADINGTFLRLNRQWETTLGYPLNELVGHAFMDFVHPDDIAATKEALAELSAQNPVLDFVNRYLCRDGSYRWIEWRAFPYGGRIYAAARDTTERRKLDESLQRGQKLESIAVLAGGIAHDFNNLLGGIFGLMESAQEGLQQGNTSDAQECLEMAMQVFDRAKALTRQLLTFSKGGAPVLKALNLSNLVKRSAEFVLSGSTVACQFQIATDLWNCECDENQIGQVIDNLVINARDAMPDGGSVTVVAKNTEGDYGPGRRGRFVCITVEDNGPGMDSVTLAKVFDPFFTTKQTGHGLGLTTVFSIVKRHGGWVDVESRPAIGTIFRVFLPASTARVESSSVGVSSPSCGSGMVLVMDDELFVVDILERMFRSMGYGTLKARDGREAIDLFTSASREGRTICLCILDLTVPGGLGGAKTASAIRAQDPTAVLVAASGYSDDPIMANPTAHGFSASLSKPFRKADLGVLVEQLVRSPAKHGSHLGGATTHRLG
jgi:PAS domain S-box-containing protein